MRTPSLIFHDLQMGPNIVWGTGPHTPSCAPSAVLIHFLLHLVLGNDWSLPILDPGGYRAPVYQLSNTLLNKLQSIINIVLVISDVGLYPNVNVKTYAPLPLDIIKYVPLVRCLKSLTSKAKCKAPSVKTAKLTVTAYLLCVCHRFTQVH